MRVPWRMPLACAIFVLVSLAADPDAATVTGRVFDVYHRPVPAAQVVPIETARQRGRQWMVAGKPVAVIDKAGMFRLTLPPGSYRLAVIPPPRELDFATVFPVYYQDTLDARQAQAITLHPGELRPFVDFLLLATEGHEISGQVTTALPSHSPGAVAVSLFASSGYAGPLRAVLADAQGRFQLSHVPSGSYELIAAGPVLRFDGLHAALATDPWTGSVHLDVAAPRTDGVRIAIRAGANLPILKWPDAIR